MVPGKRKIARMLAYLGKNLTWIIRAAVGLIVGVSAAILSNSASAASGAGTLPKAPPLPIHPPPPHGPPPVVPEVNTGLVLLPIVLAILLFTSRRFFRQGLGNR